MRRVAITGLGAVTPVGNDAETTWQSLVAGRSGIRKIEEDILNFMMEAESSQGDIKAAEVKLKEDQQKVDQERKQLGEANQRDLSALEAYLKERKEIEATISADLDSEKRYASGVPAATSRKRARRPWAACWLRWLFWV